MEAITVMPRTKKQEQLLLGLFREMKIPFAPSAREIPEEDRHWPALVEKLARTRANRAAGKLVEISTEGGEEAFWKRVREA